MRAATSLDAQCSTTCGDGVQRRLVWCQQGTDGGGVSELQCDVATKPLQTRPCNLGECQLPARWRVGMIRSDVKLVTQ